MIWAYAAATVSARARPRTGHAPPHRIFDGSIRTARSHKAASAHSQGKRAQKSSPTPPALLHLLPSPQMLHAIRDPPSVAILSSLQKHLVPHRYGAPLA